VDGLLFKDIMQEIMRFCLSIMGNLCSVISFRGNYSEALRDSVGRFQLWTSQLRQKP